MALFGRTPQNAVGGGTKDSKTKRKPESQGGLTFEQLLKQEKGNRDQAAKRFNAQGGGKHTSSAYSPKKPAAKGGGGGGGGGKAKATPSRAPVPTPRPADGRAPMQQDPTQTFAPGGSTMVPMPQMPDTSALTGVPPELVAPPPQPFAPGGSTQVPIPTFGPGMEPGSMHGVPLELGGKGNAFNEDRQLLAGMLPMPNNTALRTVPPDLVAPPAPPKQSGPFGYGGSIFGPNGWWGGQ